MRKGKKYWAEQINKLVQFCDIKGWKIVFKGNGPDQCYLTTKIIEIGTSQSVENMVYSLLHEIGHMIENQNKSWYKKKYKGLNYKKTSKIYKISIIHEEISAWDVGLKVANKLKIELNEKNFLKIKSTYIFYYLENVVLSGKASLEE